VYNALVTLLPQILQASSGGAVKFVNTSAHGYLTLAVDAAKARATFTFIPQSEVTVN